MVHIDNDIAEKLAKGDDVQAFMEETAFTMAVRAEESLAEHRMTGAAEIDIEHHDVDWYVILSDEAGEKHALSIEYGRAAGETEVTDPKTGETRVLKWGAMDGLYILADATGMPRKRKGKVKL